MLDRPPPESALSLLQHGELCNVILRGDVQREAVWSTISNRFFFTSEPAGSVAPELVEEWMPAAVRF